MTSISTLLFWSSVCHLRKRKTTAIRSAMGTGRAGYTRLLWNQSLLVAQCQWKVQCKITSPKSTNELCCERRKDFWLTFQAPNERSPLFFLFWFITYKAYFRVFGRTNIVTFSRIFGRRSGLMDHFTVLWHVTRPLYESEVRVDLDVIETKNYWAKQLKDFHIKSKRVNLSLTSSQRLGIKAHKCKMPITESCCTTDAHTASIVPKQMQYFHYAILTVGYVLHVFFWIKSRG